MSNAGASLAKYAPLDDAQQWRTVKNTEGLGYIAKALGLIDPVVIPKLRLRVNLDTSDAQLKYTHHIKAFFKALGGYKHCTNLDLGHCQLSDFTCKEHVSVMLQENHFITQLKLNDNGFTDEGANHVFSALVDSNVSDLDVSRNQLTHSCCDAVSQLLHNEKLKSLSLSHSQIGAEGIKIIAPALKHAKQLQKLLLENCRVGDEGCLEISARLSAAELPSITTLSLCENNIGRIGIEKLMLNFTPEVGRNQTVTTLDVSKNYFGDEGFGFVTDMMKKNLTMQTLKVNKVGLTQPKFAAFCEKMTVRYNEEFGPYPALRNLEVGSNGLGNNLSDMFSMLKNKNCYIEAVNYEGNEVNDFGAKLVKEFLTSSFNCDRKNMGSISGDSDLERSLRRRDKENRRNFYKLSLKSNGISSDGAENLAEIVNGNNIFNELDLRKNNIGVKGAIFFKKAFRKLQCGSSKSFDKVGRSFKLHLLPSDVTIEGVNHLAIGIRESPEVLRRWIETKAPQHEYKRSEGLQNLWNDALNAQNPTENPSSVPIDLNSVKDIPDRVGLKGLKWHGALLNTSFAEFDTPKATAVNRSQPHAFKFGVELYGENDEKEDTWEAVKLATYTSWGVGQTDRGILKWKGSVWSKVKSGWGCIVANTLYRHGLLLRLRYVCESREFIQDLYFKKYANPKNYRAFMKKMDSLTVDQLIERLVSDDLKSFWEILIHQTCEKSQGKTMFEHVLEYGDSPLVDCIRQFLNVFPSQAYSRKGSKFPAVFLQQQIALSGLTYRDLCLKSTDKFVNRYAEAKKLVMFRFLEAEPVFTTRFVKISKVEDLLLTEEYDDSERFFYMRRIAGTSAQEDEKLAANEFNAHRSFQSKDFNYLSGSNATTYDKIENLILPNINMSLDVDFAPQISALWHRQQLLVNDRLMPTFTNIYKTNLKEVIDNESLAGGRDLPRTQLILKMVALSLNHFNSRSWAGQFDSSSIASEVKIPRVHGNLKPRNIILRVADELPDLDKGVGLMPGKWVLSDFTRSTPHGEDYIPIKDSAYNPPEVAKRVLSSDEARLKSKIPADEKMDVWQFGCVLYEMLAGASLFKTEGNNDLIIDEEQRGELANWLSLDEERSDLILSQLKATRGNRSSYVSMSLNNWGNYTDEEIDDLITAGKQLTQMCLQGRPEDRPFLSEVLAHPFLASVDVGRLSVEKDMEAIFPNWKTQWCNQRFLANQPHLHLINTEFEEAGVVVKSIEHSLATVGCRLTTDSLDKGDSADYEKNLRSNVQSARVVALILTKDAFYKPNVIKQLLFAEDYRKKAEKVHGRVLFLDLSSEVKISPELKWNKAEFRDNWVKSDQFQYLATALATENPSFDSFSVGQSNYDDKLDAWLNFLRGNLRTTILSYIQDPIKYQATGFLKEPMVDRMLVDGHLVPTSKLSSFPIPSLSDKNFLDVDDLVNKKLQDHKDKFLNLYFLPANRVRKSNARVYVLCGSNPSEETFEAVSQIARAIEAPNALNSVSPENRHKDSLNPKNKLINKVKTSFNLKKDSHLKAGARSTKLQGIKDKVMNITREDGSLLLVLYATAGVFKRYSKFLHEAVERRFEDGLAIVLVKSPGFNPTSSDIVREINAFAPVELKETFKTKEAYLPYFKPKKDPWQYEAAMSELMKRARHKMDHPAPKENFRNIQMEA